MGRQMCFKSKYTGEIFPSTTRLCINLTYFCNEKVFIMMLVHKGLPGKAASADDPDFGVTGCCRSYRKKKKFKL